VLGSGSTTVVSSGLGETCSICVAFALDIKSLMLAKGSPPRNACVIRVAKSSVVLLGVVGEGEIVSVSPLMLPPVYRLAFALLSIRLLRALLAAF